MTMTTQRRSDQLLVDVDLNVAFELLEKSKLRASLSVDVDNDADVRKGVTVRSDADD
jgi:hypothetical protein